MFSPENFFFLKKTLKNNFKKNNVNQKNVHKKKISQEKKFTNIKFNFFWSPKNFFRKLERLPEKLYSCHFFHSIPIYMHPNQPSLLLNQMKLI